MNRPGMDYVFRVFAVFAILSGGCHSCRPVQTHPASLPNVTVDYARPSASLDVPTAIQPASFSEQEVDHHGAGALHSGVFVGLQELSLDALIQQVLARNPSLAQMTAAWEAASARYPQAISLDDPTLAITLGPATYGSTTVNPAYRIYLEQKYPFPGKLKLRGEKASAEADAAGSEVEDTRLQLIEAAKIAFFEYYLVYRAIAVNNNGIRLLEGMRQNALTRFKNGQAPQQDISQADVELGRQRDRGLTLEQMRQIAIARINTLLNVAPDEPLPEPPSELRIEDGMPPVAELRNVALARRPDLRALASRIAADQAALALANKEFCPDFAPFAMYDRFMGNTAETEPLATQIGMSVNLPVRRDRRRAGVIEAQARVNQRLAEYKKQANQISFEVQQAYAQAAQNRKAVDLYEKTVLPAAQLNIKSATAAYATGKINFLTLLDAERNLVGLRDRYYELLASYYSRQATLERVVGGPIAPVSPIPPREDNELAPLPNPVP